MQKVPLMKIKAGLWKGFRNLVRPPRIPDEEPNLLDVSNVLSVHEAWAEDCHLGILSIYKTSFSTVS